MRSFVYCIAVDTEAPPEGTGYVRAETPEETVALVGHPEVNLYSLPGMPSGRESAARGCARGPDLQPFAPTPPPRHHEIPHPDTPLRRSGGLFLVHVGF